MTLPKREAEAYLLNADVLRQVFPAISGTSAEVTEKIRLLLESRDPKETLYQLLRDYGVGPMDRQKAATIAQAAPLPDDIRRIFDRINAQQT